MRLQVSMAAAKKILAASCFLGIFLLSATLEVSLERQHKHFLNKQIKKTQSKRAPDGPIQQRPTELLLRAAPW